jgi:drug/metabolite transporter (DMT)-like permease
MSPGALGIVLLAAVLHASWNLVVKASRDRLVAAWMQNTIGALLFVPVLVVQGLPTAQWRPLAVSAVLHLGYSLTLVGGYDRGDLSVVYPIARGTAPLLVTAGAALFLDDRPGVVGLVAIGLIAGGILGSIRRARGGVAWAVACGGFIAAYTLVDGAAVRSGGGPLRYVVCLIVLNALTLFVAVVVRGRAATIAPTLRRDGWRHAFGGAASIAAYALVLTAARWAPLGLVSAVRETSVVLGALGGWLLLREPLGPARVAAATVITIGIVLLVL